MSESIRHTPIMALTALAALGLGLAGCDDTPAGTLTLQLDGLQVGFDASTRFRSEDKSSLTRAEFVTRVQDALQTGQPPVKVKRMAPSVPQDPTDASFLASDIKLDNEADEREIEMNMDEDNFLDPGTGGCDAALLGCVNVLGLLIELQDGVTKFEEEMPDVTGEQEFEGIVSSVDLTARTVTLADATVIQIVDGETDIEGNSDDSEKLTSLEAVDQALMDGQLVEADGEGMVQGTDPLTILAIKVEFEIEDDEDGIPGAVEFEGIVASVDLSATPPTITLTDNTVIQIVAGTTVIDPTGDLVDLNDVAASGTPVKAEGHANVLDIGPPRLLEALDVKFETGS
ncbi:MAG: hypothetical protein ACE5JM_11655 [Armatimonadota bacterium]